MRIVVTGSTGMIGQALVAALEAEGHEVSRLVRPGSRASGIPWDPREGKIDLQALEHHDAVIHLAGKPIAGLWTGRRKRQIMASRTAGTRLLAESLARLDNRPAVLVSASAVGFYGDHPAGEPVDESAPRGSGFLAHVTEAWEAATIPAAEAGVRVINARFGIVLSGRGGALSPMLPFFRLGLGGKYGSGRQIWSWVSLEDVVGAIRFTIAQHELSGPVNVVSPHPVTNLAFTRALGRVLRKPTVFGVPAFLLRAVMGQMADEMLLYGVRVVPRKLMEAGYDFRYRDVEEALRHALAASVNTGYVRGLKGFG